MILLVQRQKNKQAYQSLNGHTFSPSFAQGFQSPASKLITNKGYPTTDHPLILVEWCETLLMRVLAGLRISLCSLTQPRASAAVIGYDPHTCTIR